MMKICKTHTHISIYIYPSIHIYILLTIYSVEDHLHQNNAEAVCIVESFCCSVRIESSVTYIYIYTR